MMKMIGEQVNLTKRVNYFGIELEVPEDTVFVTTGENGVVTAWNASSWDVYASDVYCNWVSDERHICWVNLCQVDLCGVGWRDTKMDVPL